MQRIKSVSLKCPHCGHQFPSPIFITDVVAFETAVTSGNKTWCPKCRQKIDCNKENMAYVLADDSGGAVGPDFGNKDS
jgi:hypothetical protein